MLTLTALYGLDCLIYPLAWTALYIYLALTALYVPSSLDSEGGDSARERLRRGGRARARRAAGPLPMALTALYVALTALYVP